LPIGVDASLSSFLAPFGAYQTWAQQAAVDDVNAKGGIIIDGVAHRVKLVIYDDKSDANIASSNVETLITKDKVAAVLGPIVPTVGNPAALAAERKGIPYLETGNPLEVFREVTQWKWAFDFFVSLVDGGDTVFAAVDSVKSQTNGKVALCVDNSPDGPGQLAGWQAASAAHGWQAVEMPAFPEGSTDFGSLVDKLKTADCDFVCVMGDTPDLIALRKQMDAAGYRPKLLQFSRGAQVQQFADALGPLADGIMHFSYWSPDLPYPGAADLGKRYQESAKQSIGQIVGPEYAAAQILLAAIAKAGTTDPTAIRDAIAATDANYVCGPVKFAADHTSVEPSLQFQWSGGKAVIVWTADVANGKLIFPLP
jgi:branched-chain amino acid transport system substrate-binding protein